MKLIQLVIEWLSKPFKKIRRRWILAKASSKMKEAYEDQLSERKKLRSKINSFLKEFFGMDADSKFIPKDFKNKEEVRVAVCDRFGYEMEKLNVKYQDLFS